MLPTTVSSGIGHTCKAHATGPYYLNKLLQISKEMYVTVHMDL